MLNDTLTIFFTWSSWLLLMAISGGKSRNSSTCRTAPSWGNTPGGSAPLPCPATVIMVSAWLCLFTLVKGVA